MSFILDALRKSEHERQRQGGPGIADLKSVGVRTQFPLWAVALGALLLLNIVVVLILVLRGESQPAPAAPVAATPAAATPAAGAAQSAEQLAPALAAAVAPPVESVVPLPRGIAPPPENTSAGRSDPFDASQPVRAPEVRRDPERDAALSAAAAEREAGDENLPTLNDITLQGSGRIPELHLDIHVYATRPAERFVFINMRKYREGGSTPEGTRIERITRDGVVLNHRGLRFMMPRQ